MTQQILSNKQFNQLKKELTGRLAPQQGSIMSRRGSGKSTRASSRSRTPSRKRSKTPNEFRKRTIGGAEFRSGQWRGKFLKEHLKKITPLIHAKDEKAKKLSLAKGGYFADQKDNKVDLLSLQKEVEMAESELKLAMDFVKAGLGNRPIRLRLSAIFAITTTVTSGVTNTVTCGASTTGRVAPSDSTEWSSVSALFDEVRTFGGHVDFEYYNPLVALNAGVPTGSFSTTNNIPTIGYDPAHATASTGVTSLCENSQHLCLNNNLYAGASGTSPTIANNLARHKFHFKVPPGTMTGSAPSVGTQWVDCDAGAQPVGWLKFYHVGGNITASTTGVGILYYDCEFRCRE